MTQTLGIDTAVNKILELCTRFKSPMLKLILINGISYQQIYQKFSKLQDMLPMTRYLAKILYPGTRPLAKEKIPSKKEDIQQKRRYIPKERISRNYQTILAREDLANLQFPSYLLIARDLII